MALIDHYPGHGGGGGHHGPGGGGGGGGAEPSDVWLRRRHVMMRRTRQRRLRYIMLGVACMFPGLILYFGGGYLFVSAYNGQYPFWHFPVAAPLKRIFWYLGPTFFFIGLIIFVVAYASFCKGVDYTSDYY